MKKVTSIALAGGLAAALFAPAVTAAAAGYNDWHRPHHPYSNGWNPGSAFLAGTVLGLAFAAPYYYPPPPVYYTPYPPPPPPYPEEYSGNPHIDWCSATYRSYDAESDTWADYNGVVHRCIGP